MNGNYVHKRDVSNILTKLHRQIEDTCKKKGKISDAELNDELDKLLASADRDLRLKTQAIIRTRLAQSNTIPVNFAPLVKLDGHQFQKPYVPLPDPKTQTVLPYALSSIATSRKQARMPTITSINSPSAPIPFSPNARPNTAPATQFSKLDTNYFQSEPSPKKTPRQTRKLTRNNSSKMNSESESVSSRTSSKELNSPSSKVTARELRSPKSPKSVTSRIVHSNKSQSRPMTSTTSSKTSERPKTALNANQKSLLAQMAMTNRKRAIADYAPKLPRPDIHDPKAEPPPLSDSTIMKYGLQQLSESRLVKEDSLKNRLQDLITVSHFKKDLAADYRNFSQNYYLDPIEPQPEPTDDKPMIDLNQILSDDDDAMLSAATGHYIFTLINGKPSQQSAEFQLFKQYNATNWESIEIILNMLTPICEKYGLNEIKVDGNIIAEFTRYDPDEIQMVRLFRCFKSLPRNKRLNSKIGFGFVGPKAEDKAAILIQSIWRGYNARRVVRMIRRENVAAKIIQSQWRVYKLSHLFAKEIENDRHKKLLRFDASQADPSFYKPNNTHVIVHYVTTLDAVELGRLAYLQNQSAHIILYFRTSLEKDIIELIKNISLDTKRLHIIVSSLRLPNNFSIEDLFASDLKAMNSVKIIAGPAPIYIVPTESHYALVDSANRLNALAFVPSPSRMQIYESRESIRRILKIGSSTLFESSSELFDNDSLYKELAGLTVSNVRVQMWILRANDNSIAWLNSHDFSLIEKLKTHSNALTEEDFLDKSFREMMKQHIAKDLLNILNTTGNTQPDAFLRNFLAIGGTIEAGPQQAKSSPAVTFFVPPVGAPKIVGSWETLYISCFEPFATIHPAFTVNRDKLRKKTNKIASECSSKRIIGLNTIQYFYCPRKIFDEYSIEEEMHMKLTPNDLYIGKIDPVLNQLFIQTMINVTFDEESMSIGPSTYCYVQRRVPLPEPIEANEMKHKCREYSVPINEKVYLVPFLNDNSNYSMLVVEDTPEKLIHLVYRTLITISDNIIPIEKYPRCEILKCVSAIEYLDNQLETSNEITSTLLMKKVKDFPQLHEEPSRLFQFEKLDKPIDYERKMIREQLEKAGNQNPS